MQQCKHILPILCAFSLCIGMAACGTTGPTEAGGSAAVDSGTSSLTQPGNDTAIDTSGKTTIITMAESWNFEVFYPVLTPSNANNFGFTYWSRNCYDTLVEHDKNGEIVGALAESWTISEDGLTYTFTLREGIQFSDGADLTSDAVKQSFEAAVENLGMYNGSYGRVSSLIASMEAPDDRTFVMTLQHPYYAALNDLTMSNPLSIVSPAAFEGGAASAYETCKTASLGTGPYQYEGIQDGVYTFGRNPYYWRKPPDVDGFRVKMIEDNDAKVLALRSGEIDTIIGIDHIGYDAFSELSFDPAFGSSIQQSSDMTRYLGFNLSTAPFDDETVRRAVSHALDRDTICNVVLNGIETPADTLMPADKDFCDFPQTTYEFDPNKANSLMEESGWLDSDGDGVREKDGVKLEMDLVYSKALGSIDDMVLTISDQLSKIGFQITPVGSDMMSWYDVLLSGEYAVTYYYTYGGCYDPSTLMSNMNPAVSADPVFVQCSSIVKDGVALVEELDSTADLSRVQEIYQLILPQIAEQAAVVPISYSRQMAVWNSKIIADYGFCSDNRYITIADISLKAE